MKILKALIPIFIVTALALYARQYYTLLSEPLVNALNFLPLLLIILIIAVAIYFNQTKVLLSVLLISFLYLCIEYNWLDSQIKMAVFTIFTPVLLLMTQLLKKQSINSVKSLPIYFIYFFTVLFSLWVIDHQPEWAAKHVFAQWLPEKYFDWSKIPQLALGSYLIAFIGLLIYFSKKQSSQSATALLMLITTFVIIQVSLDSPDLIIIITSMLILNLIVILQESRHMAYIDELTLLPGRRALQEKIQSLVGIYTIAMVDIDHFKKFNDNYGHDTGDDVLRMIAAKLNSVTGGGTAYRYGGEEFTIVFGNKSADQTLEHLETLRENIANTKFVVNRRTKSVTNKKTATVVITVSIGVKDSINISSSAEVIKQADIALYKSKKKGRNCIS